MKDNSLIVDAVRIMLREARLGPHMPEGLDALDMEILRILAENCKRSAREIARMLGKSPTIIAKKIKKLESMGIVRGCRAEIDYKKLGYSIMALILFNVEGAYIEEVEHQLAKEPNVRIVYDITGDYDVAIVALFRGVEELDRFIKRLLKNPRIKRSVTSVVFRAVKDSPNIKF